MSDRDMNGIRRGVPEPASSVRGFVPPYSAQGALDPAALSTKRGFVFQYPPFPALDLVEADVVGEPRDSGLYVHVPFCGYRCSYCYYAITLDRRPQNIATYLSALTREIEQFQRRRLPPHRITTIFFGGGTPTVLEAADLARVVETVRGQFDCTRLQEFTIEADPTTISRDGVEALREAGVNRVSIGVQSFSNNVNLVNERQHDEECSLAAIDIVRNSGIANLNLDLICGLIGDTARSWSRTIDRLLEIGPEHATIYLFSLRPQTRSHRQLEAGIVSSPPEEPARVEWMVEARRRILNAGYVQTTPNCFAREPRFEQIHQQNAWSSRPLIGFGNSAYSFLDDCVTQNVRPVPVYVERINTGRVPLERGSRLTPRELMIRYCVLRLKLLRIDAADFEARFGVDLDAVFGPHLRRLEDAGLLTVDARGAGLSERGCVYVDDVCRSFYSGPVRDRMAHARPEDVTPLVRSLV